MWAIYAVVGRWQEDGFHNRSVPTFYLDENVQGIVSEEHAIEIATEVVNPFGDLECNITAVRVVTED